MGEGKANAPHPAEMQRSSQGGVKDTDDLSGIKGIQDEGMKEKARQAEELPEKVRGTDVPKYPQKR